MTIDDLLAERRIYQESVSREDVAATLERAKRDLVTAEKMLCIDSDWAFSISYSAVLQASRAVMFAQGYRPASHESHKNTFAFMLATAEEAQKPLIGFFDRMRVKRHQAVYEATAAVTETEARTLFAKAKEYVAWVCQQLLPQGSSSP